VTSLSESYELGSIGQLESEIESMPYHFFEAPQIGAWVFAIMNFSLKRESLNPQQ
jgi:hypothetical protein